MRLKIGLIIALLVISCTPRVNTQNKDPQRYQELKQYETTFEQAGASRGYNIHTSDVVTLFANQDHMSAPEVLGECYFDKHPRVVVFSRQYWDSLDHVKREHLVWHEMAHCTLLVGHDPRIKPDGHPVSIMYPNTEVTKDEDYYIKHRQQYINELFPN